MKLHNLNALHFFLALGMAVLLLIPYEWYWSDIEEYPKSYDLESLDNWADQRKKVALLSDEDVILLGSSRLHFDTNIDLWDTLTGRRPLQLAYPGSSPFVTLEDIVQKSDFKGLVVVGVSPGLFFTVRSGWSVRRSQAFIDRYYERTYAQVLNQYLYNFIDPHFAYLRDDLTLTQLIERWQFLNRDSIEAPPVWPPMVKMDKNRGVRMLPGMETDTVLQRRQKNIWFNPNPKNRYADSLNVIMEHYAGLVDSFEQKGGKVVFVRPPVTGYYLETEAELFPRKEYWDCLLEYCDCPGYHFADYPETKDMEPPEWSHLNRAESDAFTRWLIALLQTDNLL